MKLNAKTATVSWGAVGGGVQKYTVIVSRDGFSGPFRGYTTTGTSIDIAYSSFPYASTKSSKPFRFSVTATGKGWSSVSGKVEVSTSGSRVAVSKKNANAVASKINSCLKQGLAAGIITGGASAAAIVVTAWTPESMSRSRAEASRLRCCRLPAPPSPA